MSKDPEVYEERYEWETGGYLDDIEDLDDIMDDDSYVEFDEFDEFGY